MGYLLIYSSIKLFHELREKECCGCNYCGYFSFALQFITLLVFAVLVNFYEIRQLFIRIHKHVIVSILVHVYFMMILILGVFNLPKSAGIPIEIIYLFLAFQSSLLAVIIANICIYSQFNSIIYWI